MYCIICTFYYFNLIVLDRKFELYPLQFQHEMNTNNLVVAAPYGGPIAITRDPKKFVKVQGATKPIILLYTSSGKLTAKIQVNKHFVNSIKLGWNNLFQMFSIVE